jgi:hypothetical protein
LAGGTLEKVGSYTLSINSLNIVSGTETSSSSQKKSICALGADIAGYACLAAKLKELDKDIEKIIK